LKRAPEEDPGGMFNTPGGIFHFLGMDIHHEKDYYKMRERRGRNAISLVGKFIHPSTNQPIHQ
jgi:hypothetical protein